jgi:hypothetical protein
MGIPRWVDDIYSSQRPYIEALDTYLNSVLRPYCERHKFSFSHRVKSAISVAEKLESGRFSSWTDLDDLVAATIVVPNLTFEEQVVRHLNSVFSEVVTRSRQTAQTPPEVFRFSSTRWYGRMRQDPPPPAVPPQALPLVFEVQIQTALEYAWLIATHDTTYKGDESNWQQRRLAASVKASVEQLDLMIANFLKTAESIPISPHSETDTKTYVIKMFRDLVEEQLIESTLVPESWSRFADNVWDLVRRWKGGSATEPAVRSLVDQLAGALRRSEFHTAISGSLYQAVVAFAHTNTPAMLSKSYIMPSSELADHYGLPSLPQAMTSGEVNPEVVADASEEPRPPSDDSETGPVG